MEDKDLEKTKPIKVLTDITSKEEVATRESKYKDALEKEENKIKEEEAEEALAEKNIQLAEEILHEEKEKKKQVKELEDEIDKEIKDTDKVVNKSKDKKDNVFVLLMNKWNSLNKKQKILIGVLGGVLLLLVIVLIILLIFKLTNKPVETPKVEPPKEEVVPAVVDNFYYKEGSLYFLNAEEVEIGSYKCNTQDDSLCYVGLNSNRDDFDVTKLVDSEGNLKKQRLPIYHDNYVFIYDNKSEKDTEIILYSIKEQKELGRYLSVKAFENGNVIVQDAEKKYGLINLDATKGVVQVLKNNYNYLGMIEGEANLVAKTKDGYFIIDTKGKELSDAIDSSFKIKSYNANLIVTLTNKEYSVYDYENKLIASGYDYITTYDKYAILVDSNRLYVKDVLKNKYTESGIKLNSSEYVKTYVYDKDDVLVDTKRSFDIEVKDGELLFTLWKDGSKDPIYERLSLAEANVNKNYDYVNYFDGKLYFYKDEDKEELLGFYSCTYDNTVDMKSTKYSSCFVAYDSLFGDNDMLPDGYLTRNSVIPIINDKYVFISDGNNKVSLIDITSTTSNREPVATYMKVESNTANNDGKITKHSGNLDVIVQISSGSYGVITVGKENVTLKHQFDYTKLEFLGNYFLGYDKSGNWRVLFDGVETMGFTNKIRGYNSTKRFFKIIENNKYYVYGESATKAVDEGYAYVELYSDFYAALDSDRNLYIYGYNGTKKVNATVKVGNYALYGTSNPAFKVKKDGDNYSVSIWNGTQYETTTLSDTVVEEPDGTPEQS